MDRNVKVKEIRNYSGTMESSPEGSRLQALAEPDVNLSAHPAPITHRPRKDSHLPVYK